MEAASRLSRPEVGARRVAVLDLVRLSRADAEALGALAAHVESERDERAAVLIVRHLGAARFAGARAALRRLYDDRSTPVRVAHAAIVAHDAIEGVPGGDDRTPAVLAT
jgi:hypothetical protein